MSKEKPMKVRLIRGASFVVPGMRFVPGVSVVVKDQNILEACKRSQQFSIKDADDDSDEVEEQEAPESAEESAEESPKPKKKKGKKK